MGIEHRGQATGAVLRERVIGGRIQEVGHKRQSKSGGFRWGTQGIRGRIPGAGNRRQGRGGGYKYTNYRG